MLYYIFSYLDQMGIPGAGIFDFISFRAAMAFLFSLVISTIIGKSIINYLRRLQIGETVRDLGLEGQSEKAGTPTMGGLIILAGVLIPVLLFSRLENIYIILMLISTVILGIIGFSDDYIKVIRKHKDGLNGWVKLAGQTLLGVIVGLALFYHPDVVIRETVSAETFQEEFEGSPAVESYTTYEQDGEQMYRVDHKSTKTTIPFLKDNELDYSSALALFGEDFAEYTIIFFVLIVSFLIAAVSNGVNLNDGMDGLAVGTSGIVFSILAVFAYLSGNVVFADYLNIFYIPFLGELVIFIGAFVGACVGFLWYNSYPAQVFMGDTGSISMGGLIAIIAVMVKKELLLPLLCGIFLIEILSVIIQVLYFKYTRRKYGEGRRVFLMTPIHHHFQKKNIHESKIVSRFWIVGIILAILTLVTLKIR